MIVIKKNEVSWLVTLLPCLLFLLSVQVQAQALTPTKGFFDYTWDAEEGKMFLTVDKWDQEFLYVNSLAAGVGSNDIGLDRGQLGDTKIVKFKRSGKKALLVQLNYDYRAVSQNAAERKAVEEAFASSVVWGFKIEDKDGVAMIDITEFVLRDSHVVSQRLKRMKEGNYSLDKSKSAIFIEDCKNFPKNSELEGLITFTGSGAGRNLRSVVPNTESFSVKVHHSFIELPDNNYKPRNFDTRAAFGGTFFYDYASPIDQDIETRYLNRHRLELDKDGKVIEPIIYYLDPGAPEPIRSALIDGGKWWSEAFDAAGFKDGFQVKLLPAGVDPLDIRYNVIQWVHRSTRGWSYGMSVRDPRTGEILKGHVSLGSLRVRQDFLIASGLIGPYKGGIISGEMKEMSLARLRQLAAHEIGHTIGLAHNYASSVNDRASVMDYPHPYIKLDDNGNVDLSEAYDVGIGEWDKVTIKYGYGIAPNDQDEQSFLNGVLEDAFDRGLKFISDRDARDLGGMHPTAHLWDNGKNGADELNRLMDVRAKILSEFSADRIPDGTPYSSLEEVLVPMYMIHRYQMEAAVKSIAGFDYNYAVKGGNQLIKKNISRSDQMKAVAAMIRTITPSELTLRQDLLDMIPPKPFGYNRTRESFKSRLGQAFDPLAAAETAADASLAMMLHPTRLARLYQQGLVENQLSLTEYLDEIINNTVNSNVANPVENAIRETVSYLLIDHLGALYNHENVSEAVKAECFLRLNELSKDSLSKSSLTERLFSSRIAEKAKAYLDGKIKTKIKSLQIPDGSPIGMEISCY